MYQCNGYKPSGQIDYSRGAQPKSAGGPKNFATREKGGNHLVPGPDYMVDALKLPNQAPTISGESLKMCVAWCCPDETQHLFC
ncbi:hypothetical protein TNCV_1024021 [Trichonephila clavipes]|nr:hypothetical protein TNCV_1024021 [Trichonephila clavipes]